MIVRTAAETIGTEAGSILLNDDEHKLKFRTAFGTKAREIKPLVVKSGEGIAGWTVASGRPAVVNDVQADPRFNSSFDEATGFKTVSV